MAQSRKFSDVLYTQEYVYPKFSNGAMSVAETYVALALGFLDPRSLPPMVIFHHDNKQWCRDTRRLTLARALERNNYFQVLKEMQVEDAKKEDNSYEKQYKELILKIRAMERRKLDGKNVKVSVKKGSTCCFDQDTFLNNVIEHVAKDHLNMTVAELKEVNIHYCDKCNKETKLQFVRSGNKKERKKYRIKQNCECNDQGDLINILWLEVGLGTMLTELRKFKSHRVRFSLRGVQDDDTDSCQPVCRARRE